MSWSKTYLYQLKLRNRALFYIIITFLGISTISVVLKNEMAPFYLWAMYSRPMPASDSFAVYTLEYNNGIIYNMPHTWQDHQRMMFTYPIAQYVATMENDAVEADQVRISQIMGKLNLPVPPLTNVYISKPELEAYPAWLLRYIQAGMQVRIDSIKVYRTWVKFNKEGRVVPLTKQLLIKQTN